MVSERGEGCVSENQPVLFGMYRENPKTQGPCRLIECAGIAWKQRPEWHWSRVLLFTYTTTEK
jgi:hypothetical protein